MRKVILIILWLLPIILSAQEDKPTNKQISLLGALDSNSAWELEFSYMRRLTSWFGAGAGLNIYHQYSDEITAEGDPVPGMSISQWILSDKSKRATGMQFNPFVHINTPALFRIEGNGVNLYAEPGVLMTFLSDKNVEADYWNGSGYYVGRTFYGHGGDWLFWCCRLGIALENEYGCLSIGYLASNTDMYSFKRNIHIDNVRLGNNLSKTHFNWAVFVNLGCKL